MELQAKSKGKKRTNVCLRW